MKNLRTIFLATLMYNINAENMSTANALEYINSNRYTFSQNVEKAIAAETNKDMDSILSNLKTTHNMSELKIIGYVLSIDAINPESEGQETIKVFVNISGSNENHYHLLDGLSAFTETKDSYLMTKDHISELSDHEYKSDHEIHSSILLTMQAMVEKGNGFNKDEFIETSLLDIDDSNDQLYSHAITYKNLYNTSFASFLFYGTMNEIHMINLFQDNESNSDLNTKINNKYSIIYNLRLQSSNLEDNVISDIHHYYDNYRKNNMDANIISDNINSHLDSIDAIYDAIYDDNKRTTLFNYFKDMNDQVKAEEIAREIMIATYSNLDYRGFYEIVKIEPKIEITKSEMDSKINTISYSTNPDD